MKISGLALAALLCASSAQAELMGVVDAQNGVVVNLHREAGPCVGGARRAEYVDVVKKQNIPGCWAVQGGGVIQVAWFDGDADAIPLSAVRLPKEV